jgi:hypothetical protein
MDEEIIAEMEEFLDDTLLREFANDQGLNFGGRFEPVGGGYRCTLVIDGREMPSATAHDEQAALDKATIQAIELLTRGTEAQEPVLAFA